MKTGLGSVRVAVSVGATGWSTSLLPSIDHDSCILPVKKPVRVKEKLYLWDQENAAVSPVFGHDGQSASRHT